MAIDSGLSIDASDPFETADMEGVDSHQSPGKRGFDVALSKLRFEAFEESNLMVVELKGAFPGMLFEAQEKLVLGKESCR